VITALRHPEILRHPVLLGWLMANALAEGSSQSVQCTPAHPPRCRLAVECTEDTSGHPEFGRGTLPAYERTRDSRIRQIIDRGGKARRR
jgi:hypothetical protein